MATKASGNRLNGDEVEVYGQDSGGTLRPLLVDSSGRVASQAYGVDENGVTRAVVTDPSGSLAVVPAGASVDAFSRMRVGLPQLRLSALFDSGKRALFWDESLAGGGTSTHVANERSVDLEVSSVNDEVIRQTKEYYVYRAGQSQLVLCTFSMEGDGSDTTEEAGLFDGQDGLFLQRARGTVSFVRRSYVTGAPVDVAVAQASWNLDPLDGTGPSGHTLDLTATQILVIDFQWLGVGRVRFGFDLDGDIVYAHEILNANGSLAVPYMRTPKLPVRYRIFCNSTPASPVKLKQICSAVIREGGTDDPSVQHEARTAIGAPASVTGAWNTVLGVRLKSANIRATIRLLSVEVYNGDADAIEYAVVLNPSIDDRTGLTWANVDADSGAEYSRFTDTISVGADGEPDVGHVYPLGGFIGGAAGGGGRSIPSTSNVGDTVPVVADIAGNADEVWVIARATAAPANVRAILKWAEER